MVRLIATILYEKGKTIEPDLAIKSVYEYVDKIVIVDGSRLSSGDEPYSWMSDKIVRIEHPYDHESKSGNGAQRNIYLDYLKKNEIGSWNITLDCDECIDGMQGLRAFLESTNHDSFSIPMEHFISNFSKVDNTRNIHFVQERIFKVSLEISYPLSEHPVLCPFKSPAVLNGLVYYHFGYAEDLFKLREKYVNHLEKSEMHSKQFLQQWYVMHVTGSYPSRRFDVAKLPKLIKDYFKLDYLDEVIYFNNRMNVEVKHFEMMRQWLDHFKPKSVLEHGCGMGHYLYAAKVLQPDLHIEGYDKSGWAVENSPYRKQIILWKYDMTDMFEFKDFDLVLVLDVLEHLTFEQLGDALDNIYRSGNRFLFSIPYDTDPNIHLDETHIIKESKAWWISKLMNHGFKVTDVPEHFMFKNQLLEATK